MCVCVSLRECQRRTSSLPPDAAPRARPTAMRPVPSMAPNLKPAAEPAVVSQPSMDEMATAVLGMVKGVWHQRYLIAGKGQGEGNNSSSSGSHRPYALPAHRIPFGITIVRRPVTVTCAANTRCGLFGWLSESTGANK